MGTKLALPREGIYISKNDPTLCITVIEVEYIGDENDDPDHSSLYLVRWIEGEEESDLSAMEYEFDLPEWLSFVESEKLEFDRDPYVDDFLKKTFPKDSHLERLRLMLSKSKK